MAIYIGPILAALIGITSLMISYLGQRNTAKLDTMRDLQDEVKTLTERMRLCEIARAELFKENLSLMRQVLKMPEG